MNGAAAQSSPEDGADSGGRSRVHRLATYRWLPFACGALAVAIAWPATWAGLEADDYFHRAIHTGRGAEEVYQEPQEMFRFISGEPEVVHRYIDAGWLPWWTHPRIKAEFLQLLTVQTHVLDYALWPERPEFMHVHSLSWLAAVVVLAGFFYRRFLPPAVAAAALLAFAVDDSHGTPVGFVCNRNVLLAATFGLACLLCHDHWRTHGAWWAAPAALVLWACSLFSKEAGIATCAYLGAYAFWWDKAPLLKRLATLLPYGAVLILWRTLRTAWGYGVANMGLYVDPLDEPVRFLAKFVERAPLFLMGQWFGPPPEVYMVFYRTYRFEILIWAIVSVGLLLLAVWPLLRRDAASRFFATGMVLGLLPICATFPSNRLLMFVGVGGHGLLARYWQFVFSSLPGIAPLVGWSLRWRQALGMLWVGIHLLLAPVLLHNFAGNPLGPKKLSQSFYIEHDFARADEQKELIVVNAPSVLQAGYVRLLRKYDDLPAPTRLRCLASGPVPVTVERTAPNVVVVRPQGGYMAWMLDHLFRTERDMLASGEVISLTGVEIEILEMTPDGRPAAAEFRFAEPLGSERYLWMRWREGQWELTEPPAVGEAVTYRPPPLGRLLAADWRP